MHGQKDIKKSEMKSVYSAVRTGPLIKSSLRFFDKGLIYLIRMLSALLEMIFVKRHTAFFVHSMHYCFFTSYNGGVGTATSACDLTTDWIYMSVYMNRSSASWRWRTVEWLWRHDQGLLPWYTRVAFYILNSLVMYLHVRSAFTSSYIRGLRRGWSLPTCLSTKLCQSVGNVTWL